MMAIYQQQKIRLPSVNDIFPTSKQLNVQYQQQHCPQQHSYTPPSPPQQHITVHSPSPMTPLHQTGPVFINAPHSASAYYPVASPNIQYPLTPVELSSPYVPRQFFYASAPVYMPSKYRIAKQTRQSNAWSYEDDMLLKHLKEERNLGWREISMYFKNRTANGCQFRWRRLVALSKLTKEKAEVEIQSEGSSRSNSLESILN